MLNGSADLTRLIDSRYSQRGPGQGDRRIADKAKITGAVGNFLRVVARNPACSPCPA